jgi:nicotinamidase-related amidase
MSDTDDACPTRRGLLLGGIGVATALTLRRTAAAAESGALNIQASDTAVVIIDPQNDVLSETGKNWGAVGASVTENHTVENIERIFKAAKAGGYPVFISPHYFYPTDRTWEFNGPLETDEFHTHTFERTGPLSLEGFAGSGADWVSRFKPYIEDGKTVVVSPHKVFGPQTNDLVLQLRKRQISKIILGGMLANMCVESHLREFLEQGFEVAVVKDATAGPRHPVWGDGYQAAMINYRFLAHAVLSTDEVVMSMAR